jgi:hypothetical protein
MAGLQELCEEFGFSELSVKTIEISIAIRVFTGTTAWESACWNGKRTCQRIIYLYCQRKSD